MTTVNSSIRRTVDNSVDQKCYLDLLTEETLKKFRLTFKRYLKQFNLFGIYEPDEVLNEAVLRFKALHKGKKVPNPEAWIKKTGFNFVREMSRKRKCQNLDHNTLESVVASVEDINLDLIKQEESDRVHDALKKLSLENQQLLKLRFFQGLSWSEIAQHLTTQNGNKVVVETLRKRGERAINQLREVYFDKLSQ
jgi:RNA polymerase sigma factor (sigma-70 family)